MRLVGYSLDSHTKAELPRYEIEVKIVINVCYGGFGLSHKAIMKYAELKGIKLYVWADKITKEVYKINDIDDIDELIKKTSLGIHYSTTPEKEYEKTLLVISNHNLGNQPIFNKKIGAKLFTQGIFCINFSTFTFAEFSFVSFY